MMPFIFGYILPAFIMLAVFSYLIYRDGKEEFTYRALAAVLFFTFAPIVNVIAIFVALAAAGRFVWDKYADIQVFK